MEPNATTAALARLVSEQTPLAGGHDRPNPGRSLEVTLRRRLGGIVAKLRGSAGIEVAPCLRHCLERLAGDRTVVLDLSDLDFIGSEGLAAIITAYLRSRQFRGRLCLAAPRPAVLEVLRRTHLNKLLAVYASVEEALPPGPAVAATV